MRALFVRPFALAALLALGIHPPSKGQAARDKPPTFAAASRLVEVSVVVLDRKGAPVANLAREQFTVLDNGRRCEIAFFRYDGARDADEKRTPLPPNVFSNRVELTGGPPRNITAIVLDSLNTETADQLMVKAQAMQFLKRLGPWARVAVYHLGPRFRVIHDFTGDADSLRAELRKFQLAPPSQRVADINALAADFEQFLLRTGNSSYLAGALEAALAGEMSYNVSVRESRVRATMARLEMIGRQIAGLAGRKNVVWISGGVTMFSSRPSTAPSRRPEGPRLNPAVGEDFEKLIRQTAQRLAQAGVVLYAVDARGLAGGAERLSEMQDMPGAGGRFGEFARAEAVSGDAWSAFGVMTSITGGRLIRNSNDFSEGIRNVENDLLGAYSLAFYADPEPDGKWHALKVSVDAPGVEPTHRQGYVAEAGTAPAGGEDSRLRQALLSPLGASSIRINAHCVPEENSGPGTLRLTLQIELADLTLRQMEGLSHGEIEVVVAELSPAGKAQFQQALLRLNLTPEHYAAALEKGIPYTRTWRPAPGAILIRALVRDKSTGSSGSVDIPLRDVTPKPK